MNTTAGQVTMVLTSTNQAQSSPATLPHSLHRADTHRFFGVVTVVFLALAGLLILSELGTFLVHPESALTGRFVIEIYRSIYGVLRLPVLLFYEMQDVAWTLNAIVYGADFELRGECRRPIS